MRASVVPYSSFRGLGVGVGVGVGVGRRGRRRFAPFAAALAVVLRQRLAAAGVFGFARALARRAGLIGHGQGGAGRGRALGRGVRRAVGRKRYDDDAHHRQTQRAGRHRGDHPRVPPADLGAQRRKHPPRGAAKASQLVFCGFPKMFHAFCFLQYPRRGGGAFCAAAAKPAGPNSRLRFFCLLSVYQGYPQSTKGISTYHISSGGFCQTAGPHGRPAPPWGRLPNRRPAAWNGSIIAKE